MPFHNYRGSRESNIMHSETYKEVVKNFYRVKGYYPQSDSAIDGCLSDLILKNPQVDGDIETHVEIKWTDFSLNNKRIRHEFTEYLLLFTRTRTKNHYFKFIIVAKNVSNIPLHKKIFEKYEWESIKEICVKIEKELVGKDLAHFKKLSDDDLKDFFNKTTLAQGNIDELKLKIIQITGDYSLVEDPNLYYQKITEEENVLEEKDTLMSNLIRLENLNVVWCANTLYRKPIEVFGQIRYPPPFVLRGEKLYSLLPFRNNPLRGLIEESTIEEIRISTFTEDEDNRWIIIDLINRSVERLCILRGLHKKRDDGKQVYYFPNRNGVKEKKIVWYRHEYVEGVLNKRKCERQVFKKYSEESTNPYFLHIGVNIKAVYLNKQIFLSMIPKKVFTSNGKIPVPGNRAKELDRFFRNPLWSYNRSIVLELLFWGFVLFINPDIMQQRFHFEEVAREMEYYTHEIIRLLGLKYFYLIVADNKPKEKVSVEKTGDEIEEEKKEEERAIDSIYDVSSFDEIDDIIEDVEEEI